MAHNLVSRLRLKNIFLLFTAGLIGLNSFYLFVFIRQKQAHHLEWLEPGYQFHTFAPHLEGESELGYITDKTITREVNDGVYLQAQYFLAPLLVKEGYHRDRFNIIDSENVVFIRKAFLSTKSERVGNNAYGQALMRRRSP
jgi:hypothetical protein